MKSVLDEFVIHDTFSGDRPRQLVVVDAEGLQTSVPNSVVAGRKGSTEFVVVEVEMAKCYKILANVVRKSSVQLIAPNIEIDASSPP